jgi:hypothetical protein
MSAVYRRSVEAEILADNPSHSVQLSDRYPRQMARKPLSVRPALSIRSARGFGRRIRRSVHSPRLDKPRPLRYPMAPTHGNLVLSPSWPVARRGIEDYRKRRTFTPTIASPSSSISLGPTIPPNASLAALFTGCFQRGRSRGHSGLVVPRRGLFRLGEVGQPLPMHLSVSAS